MRRSTSILIRAGQTTVIYPVSGNETFQDWLRRADQVRVRIESEESIEDITYDVSQVSCRTIPREEFELAEQETVPGAPVGELDPADSDPNQRKVH